MLSGELLQAGRALARLPRKELALRAGLSLAALRRLEGVRGPLEANGWTIAALLHAFATFGVFFEFGEADIAVWRRDTPLAAPPPA